MFVIETPYMDLEQIYNSDQNLRWIKLRDYKYICPVGNKVVKIEQNKNRFMIACNEEDFYQFWFKYFGFDLPYDEYFWKLRIVDRSLQVCANRANGVRIIKQDLFETMVKSILRYGESRNHFDFYFEQIAFYCGEEKENSFKESGRIKWTRFPTANEILDNETSLKKLKLGLGSDYDKLIDLSLNIVEGWLDLKLLDEMSYDQDMDYLSDFDEIFSYEQIKFILLYGLRKIESFVHDDLLDEAINKEYGFDSTCFVSWFGNEIKGLEGLSRQYLIYNYLNPPRKMWYQNGTYR